MSEQRPPIPEFINQRYRVLRLLGKGGMGQVFLVEDAHREDRRMALKTLLPETTDHILTSGFRDEFAELAKLEHPNLARAYDFGRVSGSSEFFFTTEFVEGVELTAGTVDATTDQLVNITAQILRALDFIHSHGILHNDLKPGNILLAKQLIGEEAAAGHRGMDKLESLAYGDKGRVKIIDFGLISREHTAWDRILGTLRYISPERILRQKADRRSDLYSIGAVLYTLYARQPPFNTGIVKALLEMHLKQSARPIQERRPDLPEPLCKLVHKLLQKMPRDRFQSGADALHFLGGALGWEEPQEISPSAGWKGGRLSAGALLHREEELERLRGFFDSAVSDGKESRSVILQGASGSGKTRLVEEMRGCVQVSGGAFVDVSGAALEGTLQPVVDALISSLQTSGVSGLERIKDRLAKTARERQDLSHALERIILWFTKTAPMLLHVDGYEQASKTVRKFVVELLHTAENRMREEEVPCRLLVVISRRSAADDGDVGISGIPIIELPGFSETQSARFLYKVFGQEDIPEPVLSSLVRAADGNPLFLLELANHLVDQQQVSFSGTRWNFPESLDGVELPVSVDGIFEDKLDSLDETLFDLLCWVAVSGRPLHRGVLSRCARLKEDKLDESLDELSSKNLVTRRRPEDGDEDVQLTHSRCRGLLFERLGDQRLKLFHQRIAQNTEEEFPDWEERADVLAEHWTESGNDAGFLRFAPKAAELLRRRGDFEKAVSYHQRIVDAMPETALARKVQSLAKLSEMYEFLWDLKACLDSLQEIRRLGWKLMKPVDRALLLRRIACVEAARYRYDVADRLLVEAAGLLEGAPTLLRLSVDAPRAMTLWFTKDIDAAGESLEKSEKAILQLRPPESDRDKMLYVGTVNHLASLDHLIGDLERASLLLEKNLEILEAMEQPQALGATHCVLGGVLLEKGDYGNAEDHLTQALRIGKETGDRRTLCRARDRLGAHYLHFGRFREALRVTQVGLQDAEDINNSAAVANSLRTLGRIYLCADETRNAKRSFKKAISAGGRSGDVLSRGLARLELASFHLQQDEVEEATKELEACGSETRGYRIPLLEGISAMWRFVASRKGSGHCDEGLLSEARSTFTRHGYHGEHLELVLAECEAAIEIGHEDRARSCLEELARLTEEHTKPDLRLEASYLLARIYGMSDERDRMASILQKTREEARNRRKLRLARRCEEALAPQEVER